MQKTYLEFETFFVPEEDIEDEKGREADNKPNQIDHVLLHILLLQMALPVEDSNQSIYQFVQIVSLQCKLEICAFSCVFLK